LQQDCLVTCPGKERLRTSSLLSPQGVGLLEEKQGEGDTKLRVLCAYKYETIALMHAMKKNYDEHERY